MLFRACNRFVPTPRRDAHPGLERGAQRLRHSAMGADRIRLGHARHPDAVDVFRRARRRPFRSSCRRWARGPSPP